MFDETYASHDGFQILRKGVDPVLVENTHAQVEIGNPSACKATALDVNGRPMNEAVAVQRRGDLPGDERL